MIDFSCDRCETHRLATRILDLRHGHRHAYGFSIFADMSSLAGWNSVFFHELFGQSAELILLVLSHQHRSRAPQDFSRRIPINTVRTFVPADNGAAKRVKHNRVIRAFYD